VDTQVLKIVGQVAGIGGIALGVLLLLFREVIRLKVFPQLAKTHAYKIIRLILLLVWSIALAGIGAWVWVETQRDRPAQGASLEEARDRAFLVGYYGAFALAQAKLGQDIVELRSAINAHLRELGLLSEYPADPVGTAGEPAAAFFRKTRGELSTRDTRLEKAFTLGWFGVISVNTPSLKPQGFEVAQTAKEAGINNKELVRLEQGILTEESFLQRIAKEAQATIKFDG
jgi:hypothetical protein